MNGVAVLLCALVVWAGVGYTGRAVVAAQQLSPSDGVKRARRTIPGRYIVVLSGPDDPESVGLEAASVFRGRLRHVYHAALRGFAVELSDAAARVLARDPRVRFVQEDALVTASQVQSAPPNWGLDRIDQAAPVSTGDGLYHYDADGTGVHAYIIDSGIRTTHIDFGGRASSDFDAVGDGYGSGDCEGHGTHVAGIVGGALYGVAKNVRLHSVRALDCSGTGSWSNVIAALDYVIAHQVKPAIINMSLSGPAVPAANDAVQSAIAAGITVVAAAGNDSEDACMNSPGAVPEAIVVAASDRSDSRAAYSDFGTCVDLFGPGSSIVSASNQSDGGSMTLSGTSMAAPHAAGAAAIYLQEHPTAKPWQVSAALVDGATFGVVADAAGSPNRLLYVGSLATAATSPWTPNDVGAVGRTGLASIQAGAMTLSPAGHDLWGSADAIEFVHQTWTGDGDLTAHLTGLVNASGANFTMAGVMVRESLAAGSRFAALLISTDGKAKFRRRTETSGSVASDGPGAGTTYAPKWLKLSRRQNVFTASVSSDGTSWTQIAVPQSVALPALTEIGVFALRDGGSSLAEATFDNVGVSAAPAVLPSPWDDRDIGAVGSPGGVVLESGTYTVAAAGSDLWGAQDALHFVYRPWTGDGELVARVKGITNPAGSSFALAGLTMRETLGDTARQMSIILTTDGKAKFRRRTTTGGDIASNGPTTGTTYPPRWLKLSRKGNAFSAFTSTDGSSWQQVYTTQSLALPQTIYVGLIASRAGGSGLTQATFSSVSVAAPATVEWFSQDVGAVDLAGNATIDGGSYTLSASGTDLWGTSDAVHFVYKPWTGDGQIVARVDAIRNPAGSAFTVGGIDMRETLGSTARQMALIVTSDGKAKFRRRTTVGGAIVSDGPSAGTTPVPRWLRLTRRGNEFTAEISVDGSAWQPVYIAQTFALPSTLYVGLIASRQGGTGLTEVAFSHVAVN